MTILKRSLLPDVGLKKKATNPKWAAFVPNVVTVSRKMIIFARNVVRPWHKFPFFVFN
jgi:hypothetical protein